MSDRPQGPGWWQASDLKWYPPEKHANYEAPPSTESPIATKSLADRSKVWFTLAGIALILLIAALVAGRVLLGNFLPGVLIVAAIAAIAATFVIRSGRSARGKAVTVAAIVLVVAAAVPASLKVVYPVYHHFFTGGGTVSSSAPSGGPSGQAPAAPSGEPSGEPSGQTPSGPSSGPPGQAPSAVTSGILTLTGTPGHVFTYGFIDPNSGNYSKVASFDVSQCVCSSGEQIYVSPDFKRFAFTKNVDGHQDAGWIDTKGNFTDVTTHANPGAFGGRPTNFTAVGFDGTGNFYYEAIATQATDNAYFKLTAGSTTNPEKIKQGNLSFAYLNQDGSVEIPVKSCFQPIWAGPNKMLDISGVGHPHGVGTQINKADAVKDASTGCVTASANAVPLLPKTNTTVVENAVSNRDGTQVAFKYDTQSLKTDLYIVAADGSSQPKKVPVADTIGGTPLGPSVTLLNWL
jgi:hypothetical protein